ncbi:MAG: AEC family transporter, partial [Candidatus Lokiarchaeota archaeon]|nr:AEC family transporter [Candidatus Lokiarchaeota archaeon]
MADVNYTFLLSLTIILIGFILKKANIIKEENGKIIAKIIFNVTLPAIILKVTSTIEFNLSLSLIPLIHIIFGLGMLGIALILFRNYPRNIKGLILMTVIGFNVVHLAFPLVEGIWGEEGLQYIVLVDAGNALTVFLFCYIVGCIFSPALNNEEKNVDFKHVAKRLLKSAPLISYVIALTINFSGIIIPIFITDILDIFARANTALTLLLLGIYLSFKFEKAEWNVILKVLIIRYLIGLSIGLSLFFFLPIDQFPHLYRVVIT